MSTATDAQLDLVTGPSRSPRPWPAPRTPWVMAQRWSDLLFAHWPVDPEAIRALVPPSLEPDTFDGQAWIGVVPFRMSGVRVRLTPALPWLSAFPELNVRTYVTVGGKAGVYFFSLDAANPVAVAVARRTFFLPYMNARMHCLANGDEVRYASRRTHRGEPPARLLARYRPTGPAFRASPGSLEEWLTARYCLYAVDRRGRPWRGEIDHVPWPLQPAEAELRENTLASAAGIELPNPLAPPHLLFVRSLGVTVWPIRRVALI